MLINQNWSLQCSSKMGLAKRLKNMAIADGSCAKATSVRALISS